MSKSAFRTITVLLTISVVSFFVIQFLWIKNSISVAENELKNSSREALEEVALNLELRNNMFGLKQELTIKRNELQNKKGLKIVMVDKDSALQKKKVLKIEKELEIERCVHPGEKRFEVVDCVLTIVDGKRKLMVRKPKAPAMPRDLRRTSPENYDSLLTQLFSEIRTFNTTPLERISGDTLKKIIASRLLSRGLSLPFEYAIKNGIAGRVLLSSEGFPLQRTGECVSVPVFKNNIIKTPDTLYLYFPDTTSLVYSKLKTLLAGSAVFALFILFAFVWTLRLISRQKKLSEIRNDFINNMTHELKTPIATIAVAADALQNSKVRGDTAKMEYYSSVVKSENQKMNRNVERVLQLALTDKENFKPHLQETNLNELIKKCLSNFQLLLNSYNGKCELSLDESMGEMSADTFHLEHALNNLIDNAIKYSESEPDIKLESEKLGNSVRIVVEDKGIGMCEEQQKKVFDKFYRAQRGNIHYVKGFGIGLSYVYNVVKAHKGNIEVESAPGKGSRFIVTLPIA